MTQDEANEIAQHAVHVDDGCIHCVTGLLDALSQSFPDVDWRKAVRQADIGSVYSHDEYIARLDACADDDG